MHRLHAQLACLMAGLVAVVLTPPTSAGDKKKDGFEPPKVQRGAEHKVLESLVGTFDAKIKLFLDPAKPPMESTGVLTRKMILDGNFLQESFEGTFFGKPFSGQGTIGYDQVKKKYVNTWCDNMSTSLMLMHGSYDAEKKTLTFTGEEVDKDGKKIKARDVLKVLGADKQFFEMLRQPAGAQAEVKVMEISYTRKKAGL